MDFLNKMVYLIYVGPTKSNDVFAETNLRENESFYSILICMCYLSYFMIRKNSIIF
jgi:hypothetical protein